RARAERELPQRRGELRRALPLHAHRHVADVALPRRKAAPRHVAGDLLRRARWAADARSEHLCLVPLSPVPCPLSPTSSSSSAAAPPASLPPPAAHGSAGAWR